MTPAPQARASIWRPRHSVRARFAIFPGISGVLFASVLAFWVVRGQREQLLEAVNASVRREAAVLGQTISAALAERQSQVQPLELRLDGGHAVDVCRSAHRLGDSVQ